MHFLKLSQKVIVSSCIEQQNIWAFQNRFFLVLPHVSQDKLSQSMQVSLSTTGYKNPSISSLNEIAPLGQMSPQALQPQHSDLLMIFIIGFFSMNFIVVIYK